MGQKAAQYEWAAVACSDLLEIATQLTPDEFKLYFIILALVRRNEGEPGHEFNSLRATRRMLRHFFGPIALNRLGRLAHRRGPLAPS